MTRSSNDFVPCVIIMGIPLVSLSWVMFSHWHVAPAICLLVAWTGSFIGGTILSLWRLSRRKYVYMPEPDDPMFAKLAQIPTTHFWEREEDW